MIPAILGVLLFFGIIIYVRVRTGYWEGIFFALFFAIAYTFAFAIMCMLVAGSADEARHVERKTDIIMMTDGSSTKARWSLFGGYLEDKAVFSFYTSDRGVKRLEQVDADKVFIVEDRPENPYIHGDGLHCGRYRTGLVPVVLQDSHPV